MANKPESYIGYLKYTGKLVEDGFLDARKSAKVLLGFDEAVRFFVLQQVPDLKESNFEFPVRVQKGSWEIVIPEAIAQWFTTAGVGLFASRYLYTAAKKMAERDFDNIGFKDIFKNSLIAIQWVIKIGKHIGDLTIKKFENLKFRDNNQIIGIPNSEGDYLFVPKDYLNLYIATNPRLLSKITEIIDEERILSIGVYDKGKIKEEIITRRYRQIFTHEDEDSEDTLFPELVHGQDVVLEGEVTRANGRSNTIGFYYKEHILMGLPKRGNIVQFKATLFLKCRIYGIITREDEFGNLNAKRPRIIFTKIDPLENDEGSQPLFE